MMNFPRFLKNKLSALDSQALNSLRLVIVLSLTLVFGVVLYHRTFNPPLFAKQATALADSQAVSRVSEPVVAAEQAVKESERGQTSLKDNVYANTQEGDLAQEIAPSGAISNPLAGEQLPISQPASNPQPLSSNPQSPISAKSAIAVDGDTGEVFFQKNADERLPMASLTKLMTAVIVSENLDLKERVSISKDAVAQDGAAGGLKAGEEFSVEDLMKAMLIVSSNDAASAFQEHFAGKNLDLIALMNQKADELGMKDTRFANPTGLDEAGHYSTARDLAKLASYVLRKDGAILGIISQKQSTIYSLNKNISHYLLSTNQLLQKNNPDILGGKTGFTKEAQGCMISILKSGKVIVVLNSQDRFGETEKLIQNLKIKM